jgi:bifunctional non-homologous end joining protein LigD
MAHSFPELIACLHDMPDVAIDGELVVLNDLGAPQFERLRWRALMSRHKEVVHAADNEPAAVFAFDLLMLDGEDLRKSPLMERKAALEPVLARCPRIKYASHIEVDGEAFFKQVSQLGLEGVVCKRADSAYVAGPSRHWVKIKTAAGKLVDDERLRHLRA